MITSAGMFSINHSTMIAATSISCLLIIMSGCGRDYGVELYRATGTITLDGQPLANASVEFRPDPDGKVTAPRGGIGFTDEAGEYIVLFRDARGCPAGDFKVVVSTYAEPTKNNENGSKQRVPRRYRGQDTNLKCSVEPDGENVFNFDLTTSQD